MNNNSSPASRGSSLFATLAFPEQISPALSAALPLFAGGQALDLGAGCGVHSLALTNHGYQVTAWEENPRWFGQLQTQIAQLSLSNLTCQQVNWQSLRFNGGYQLIISLFSMMNMPAERIPILIADMQAATTREGLNLIVAPIHDQQMLTEKGLCFAFHSGELSHYYRKWQIISYDQQSQYSIILNGQTYHTYFATLLARKASIKEG